LQPEIQHAPAGAEALEELVATVLETPRAERPQLFERLAAEDPQLAARVRERLAVLGEFGLSSDEPRRGFALPERFGAWNRLERVGVGGMGEVYLARHKETGQLAAIKLVRHDQLCFESARARFEREIEAVSRLHHPGIVRVLAVGDEQGMPWLALEWIGGASLEELLEELRGLPPETLGNLECQRALRRASARRPHAEAAREDALSGRSHVECMTRLVLRVAYALQYAHAQGVLHRDIKPSNVLVTLSGRVLLADFGLALPRGVDRLTRSGAWLGSLPYAAPEQVEGGTHTLDARADVYSLGVTLYELLTLRTPFLGGPESAVRRRIATGDVEAPRRLNPRIPAALERVCLAAMDPDPQRRPADVASLAADLERALAGEPVRARSVPTWLRLRRWSRRRPRQALTLAGAALVVLGATSIAVRESVVSAQLTRLADVELARGLRDEARGFWPARQANLERMSNWIGRAEELLARRPEYQRAFDELTATSAAYTSDERSRDQAAAREQLEALAHEIEGLTAFIERGDRAAPPPPPEPESVRERDQTLRRRLDQDPAGLIADLRAGIAALRQRMLSDGVRWRPDIMQLDDFERILDRSEVDLAQRATFRFGAALDTWRHGRLRRLLEDVRGLDELLGEVRAQRDETRRLSEIAEGEGAVAWERAIREIAASPRYGGLRLRPIFGLVPLGQNPATGLWEFLHARSGAAPERSGARGELWRIEPASGIVLVLVPGGRCQVGQRPREEPAWGASLPLHAVELDPFFISRYELTVAQAQRLGGIPSDAILPEDGRLPLGIDWPHGRALLVRHGLELPTEARWECAARAGSEVDVPLEGHANLHDISHVRAIQSEGSLPDEQPATFDDGFPGLAPVGSLAPNDFGLHDTLGNVSEWCLDNYVRRGYSTLVPRAGDGLRKTVVSAQLRSLRGGSYNNRAMVCNPWMRMGESPGKLTYCSGVRPVRSISAD